MSVSIIWSLTNGGESALAVTDHGNVRNGETTTALELFVRHNGSNPITNVGVFIRKFTGTYSGGFTPTSDFNELISWGNATTAGGFGGVHFNFMAINSYASRWWPTYTNKSVTLAGEAVGAACRTGVGDDETNALTLLTTTGCTANGTIQIGSSPNVRFQMRVAIPTDEDTVGIRQWENLLRYNYTS